MTHNQIDYARYREDRRHNRASEKENTRHNTAQEGETLRHNTVTELQTGQTITETNRHNLATESLQDKQIVTQAETARYAADKQAETTITAANINAAASMYGADQAAAANRYSANMSYAAQKYYADAQSAMKELESATQRITTMYKEESANKRADADRASREAINAANNALKLQLDASDSQKKAAQNRIERSKAEAERLYKEGKIKIETFNAIVNAADTALDYIKEIRRKKR